MDILEKLESLRNYYQCNRAVGHTEAMIRGAQNMDKVAVLFPTHRMADALFRKRNTKADLLSLMDVEALRGMNLPLVMDHTVIESLCFEAILEIEKLRNKLYISKEKLWALKEI